MNQSIKAKTKIINYLNQHFINFYEDIGDGTERLTIIYKGCKNCPDKMIESCIYFLSDCMECRVYYNATGAKWCKDSGHQSELMRLLNYINATVWPRGSDGIGGSLYKTSHLYTPRIYMTEEGCNDITMTTVVPYDFF